MSEHSPRGALSTVTVDETDADAPDGEADAEPRHPEGDADAEPRSPGGRPAVPSRPGASRC